VNRRWSAEMLKESDLKAEILPEVFESPEISGRVSKNGAAASGLREGSAGGCGRGGSGGGAVGMGIVEPGMSARRLELGLVFAATSSPVLSQGEGFNTFCHAIPGRWHVMGVTPGAGFLRCFRDQFAAALLTML